MLANQEELRVPKELLLLAVALEVKVDLDLEAVEVCLVLDQGLLPKRVLALALSPQRRRFWLLPLVAVEQEDRPVALEL